MMSIHNHPGDYKLAIIDGKIYRVHLEDTDQLPEYAVLYQPGDKVELEVLPKDFPQEILQQVIIPVYDDSNTMLNPVFWTHPIWTPKK